jgi:hypothetical protein
MMAELLIGLRFFHKLKTIVFVVNLQIYYHNIKNKMIEIRLVIDEFQSL